MKQNKKEKKINIFEAVMFNLNIDDSNIDFAKFMKKYYIS